MTDSLTPAEAVRELCEAMLCFVSDSAWGTTKQLESIRDRVVDEPHKRSWEQFDD